jgi:hypothetical protein
VISISSAGESVSIGSSTVGARRSSGTIEGVYTGSAKNWSSSSMKPKEVGYQIFVVNCRERRWISAIISSTSSVSASVV